MTTRRTAAAGSNGPGPVRHRPSVLRQALLALHAAQRHLRLLVLQSRRRARQPAEPTEAVRRPLDARREPVQRMAVLHGAVQRDGAAGVGEAARPGSISRRSRWSGSPGTAAGSTSGSTTSASTRPSAAVTAEDGYRLWLRYEPIADAGRLAQARALCASVYMPATTPTLAAARDELARGLAGCWARASFADDVAEATLIVGTPLGALGLRNEDIEDESPLFRAVLDDDRRLRHRQRGGAARAARSRSPASPTRASSTACSISCAICRPASRSTRSTSPAAAHRPAHARSLGQPRRHASSAATPGRSLWQLGRAARRRVDPRIATTRAPTRRSASTRVVAQQRQRQRADPDRADTCARSRRSPTCSGPTGMRGLSVRALRARRSRSAGSPTADPLDPDVAAWWRAKADEIYALIPDFGGFLVKANSEGQPGPQDYGRTHADGANMLADALAPHGGVVIWRAFVYDADVDRGSRQAGLQRARAARRHSSAPTSSLQVKNGPIDFQPREPFHPLFGAMPTTPLMLELQITQEYLGQGDAPRVPGAAVQGGARRGHLRRGPGLDGGARRRRQPGRRMGRLTRHRRASPTSATTATGAATRSRRPTGTPSAASPGTTASTADAIADEWIRMTFTADDRFVAPVKRDDAGVARGGRRLHDAARPAPHHGRAATTTAPAPGSTSRRRRADWTSVYYHRADARRHRLRPHRDRQRRRLALSFAAARAVRRPRHLSREPAALVPPRALGPPHASRAGRSGTSSATATAPASTPSARMQATWDAVAPYVDARAPRARPRSCSRSRSGRRAGGATPACSTSRPSRAAPCPPASSRSQGTLDDYRQISRQIKA